MSNCLFGWDNRLLSATLTASAEVAGLDASQLQNPHGSTATAWQTPVAVTAATLTMDLITAASIGALSLHKTNLTPAATLRWRVSNSATFASTLYDTGTGPAGIVAGYGQSIVIPPTAPTGRYVRLDLDDPLNPESCLRIAQAFVGPVARPIINFDFPSTFRRDLTATRFITRGGQKFVEPRFTARAWRVALSAVAEADVWPLVQEMQRAAEDGRNILFVPFPAGADAEREAIFGTLEEPSELSWQQRIATWRSWSATVVERN